MAWRKMLGDRAEAAVVNYLHSRGVSVEATQLRLGHFELDIVARDGRTICVVEVRYRGRSAWLPGFSSLDGRKRQRIRYAGERLWRMRYAQDFTVDRMRFDAASVFAVGRELHVDYRRAAF